MIVAPAYILSLKVPFLTFGQSEYIVQARRSGADWYVGAMTNHQARTVTIPTTFLSKGKYMVEIYNDNPSLGTRTNVDATTMKIKAPGKPITLPLQPSGGAALHFKPIE